MSTPIVITLYWGPFATYREGEQHWHHCPTCYESKPCTHACTPEPDQDDDAGRPHGSIVECNDCATERATMVEADQQQHGGPYR